MHGKFVVHKVQQDLCGDSLLLIQKNIRRQALQ